MPLLDHFHPPLSLSRNWESFHSQWASSIAYSLNRDLLPQGYFAEMQVHVGRIEVDVATFEQEPHPVVSAGGGTATATMPARVWTPPAVLFEMPAVFPDSLEILVYNSEAGPTLVAAVELISPGNKDRKEARRAFAAKCASYLQQGIGVVVVDIVTDRHGNLHNELVRLLELDDEFLVAPDPLSAMSYRPVRERKRERITVWLTTLWLGQALPIMPLWLDKGVCLPLDLETTYIEACERSRLPVTKVQASTAEPNQAES